MLYLSSFGSQKILFFGKVVFSKILMIFLKTVNDWSKPFWVTRFKLSNDVWYSGKVPYLDLQNPDKGRFILGLQYCLSSLPLSKCD